MDVATARELFSAARVARLALNAPFVVPISFAVDGDVIWTAVDDAKRKRAGKLHRVRLLEADPRVSLVADHYADDDWASLWWVRADGVASILPSSDEGRALLCARYPQYAEAPPPGPFLRIEVSRWVGWSAS